MLLDPFEEQLDLPTALVDLGDGERRQGEVVGQEDQSAVEFFVVESDAPELLGVPLFGIEAVEHDDLIALQSSGLVHGLRIEPVEMEAASGPGDEEC
jgi:hypothetical protein